MASQKKKKRSADEYNAPAPSKRSANDDGGANETSKAAKASKVAKAKKRPTRSRPAPKRSIRTRWSARSQWVLLASITALVVVGLVVTSFLSLRGGSGNTDYERWDLPLIADDTDDPGPVDGRVKLADYAGRPLVVKFFNSECRSCSNEYPWLLRIYADLDAAFGLVFVNTHETGDWRTFAENWQLDLLPIAKDIRGDARDGLYKSLGATNGTMPVTAYYDQDSQLQRISYEATSEVVFLAELDELGVTYPGYEIPAEVVPADEETGADGSGADVATNEDSSTEPGGS